MKKLSANDIRVSLKSVPEWKRVGSAILRNFRFKDFVTAMKFVNRMATLAEKASHHPDIDIRWNSVKVLLTTHDAGGLTDKDFTVAAQIDAAVGRLPLAR